MAIMAAQINVRGTRQLERNLKEMGNKVARRIGGKAVNFAMTPVLKAARQNAPDRFGVLKRALAKKTLRNPVSGIVTTIVGVKASHVEVHAAPARGGGQRLIKSRPLKYIHLVEHGGRRIRPNPFIARSFRQQLFNVDKRLQFKLNLEIDRAAATLPKVLSR